jgi:mono/diheme cytochrome c family protein
METDPPVPSPTSPTIISYGGGRCAVCHTRTRTGNLMCARHWGTVPHSLKTAVYDALRRYNWGGASLGELRSAQAAAVEYVTGQPQAPTLEGSEDI